MSGIYIIANLYTNKVYVGSCIRPIKDRWREHRNDLIAGRHENKHLQASWNEYGGGTFSFCVLENCDPKDCIEREQHWIDWYKAADPNFGYNSRPKADSNLGIIFGPHTDSHKAKISKSNKESWRRAKLTRKTTTLAKILTSKRLRGKKQTQEHIDQKTKTRMENGYTHSEETRKKIGTANAIANLGNSHKVSEETKIKISLANKGKLKGVPWSPARRAASGN